MGYRASVVAVFACLAGCGGGCRTAAPAPPSWWTGEWVQADVRRRAESANADDHWTSPPLECDLTQIGLQPDAYVTWEDYGRAGNGDQAMYIWNGEPVGRGADGFDQVLMRLRQLPPGSLVLFYPAYLFGWAEGGAPPAVYPWRAGVGIWPNPAEQELKRTLVRHRLVIYHADRDHLGRLIQPDSRAR